MVYSDVSGSVTGAVASKPPPRLSTEVRNQAQSTLLFLYRKVLEQELPWLDDIHRAQRLERLPTVLSRDEVQALLAQMSGAPG
jgi:hypothetical protein